MLLQDFLAQGIAMIHEIAGKDGREMQVLAVFTRQMIHPTAHLMRHITDQLQGVFIICLDKTRYLREIHLTLLGESLHRIKHTIMQSHSLENIHRDRACRMQKNLGLLSFAENRNQLYNSTILHRNDVQICI